MPRGREFWRVVAGAGSTVDVQAAFDFSQVLAVPLLGGGGALEVA